MAFLDHGRQNATGLVNISETPHVCFQLCDAGVRFSSDIACETAVYLTTVSKKKKETEEIA